MRTISLLYRAWQPATGGLLFTFQRKFTWISWVEYPGASLWKARWASLRRSGFRHGIGRWRGPLRLVGTDQGRVRRVQQSFVAAEAFQFRHALACRSRCYKHAAKQAEGLLIEMLVSVGPCDTLRLLEGQVRQRLRGDGGLVGRIDKVHGAGSFWGHSWQGPGARFRFSVALRSCAAILFRRSAFLRNAARLAASSAWIARTATSTAFCCWRSVAQLLINSASRIPITT